jgi:hypothetical protein
MSTSLPSDPADVRRIVDGWVADQTETLEDAERAALDADHPRWREDAAQLIAEGLLAYVIVEMVAPDLAIARTQATGSDQHRHTDGAELTARLGAHLRDFIDYRAELVERAEIDSSHAANWH